MKKEKIEEKLGIIKELPLERVIEEYKMLFQAEFKDEVAGSASKEEGNYNLLAKAFEDIGDKYREASASHEGKNTDTICRNFTDSLLHYQYAIQIFKDFVSDDYDISNLEAKANELYVNFVKVIGYEQTSDAGPSKLLAALSHKDDIESLRREVKARIESIQSINKEREDYKPEYLRQSDALFRLTSKGMKEYLSNIVKDAEKALGKPPCKYSVIGLGSMAMKQITPYSDLEFAILVAEDSDEVQEYFLKFGHYINFAVTALGESPIAYNKYNVDFDKLSKIAVNLDLGGKTSLGREDKDYSLVCDIAGMVRNLKGEYDASIPEERRDEKLPLILGNVCHVSGDSKLTKDYQSEANDFLLSPSGEGDLTNAQLRARDILSKDGISRKSNLDEFAFNPTEKEGHLFDVKQEIYRIPDRMIYNLGKLYNICQEEDGLSPLEIISKLEKGNYICSEAAENFRFAVSYANILRLRVYDFYGEQKEKIDSINKITSSEMGHFSISDDEKEFTKAEGEFDGGLIEFYYTIIPLMNALESFCDILEDDEEIPEYYFNECKFRDSDSGVKADIALRLMQHDKVIEFGLNALESGEKGIEIHELHDKIASSYRYMAEHELALKHYQISKVLKYKNLDDIKVLAKSYLDIAITHSNIASIYMLAEKYEEALPESEKAFELIRKYSGQDSDLAILLGASLGYVIFRLGDNDKSLELMLEVEKLDQKSKSKFDLNIAQIFNNIGLIYFVKEEYDKALSYYMKSLSLKIKCYNPEHPYLATLYNNISTSYSMKEEYDLAYYYCEKGLNIRKKFLPDNHPNISDSYSTMSTMFQRKGELEKAYYYAKKAIDIREEYFSEEQPENSIIFYKHLSEILIQLCRFKEAANYESKQLHLIKKFYTADSKTYRECDNSFKQNIDKCKIIKSAEEDLDGCIKKIEKAEAKINKNPKKFNSVKRKELSDIESNMLVSFNISHKILPKELKQKYLESFIKLYQVARENEKALECIDELHHFESMNPFAADDIHEGGIDLLGDA